MAYAPQRVEVQINNLAITYLITTLHMNAILFPFIDHCVVFGMSHDTIAAVLHAFVVLLLLVHGIVSTASADKRWGDTHIRGAKIYYNRLSRHYMHRIYTRTIVITVHLQRVTAHALFRI